MQIWYNHLTIFLITTQLQLKQGDMQLCLIVQFVPAVCFHVWKHSELMAGYVGILIHLNEGLNSLNKKLS